MLYYSDNLLSPVGNITAWCCCCCCCFLDVHNPHTDPSAHREGRQRGEKREGKTRARSAKLPPCNRLSRFPEGRVNCSLSAVLPIWGPATGCQPPSPRCLPGNWSFDGQGAGWGLFSSPLLGLFAGFLGSPPAEPPRSGWGVRGRRRREEPATCTAQPAVGRAATRPALPPPTLPSHLPLLLRPASNLSPLARVLASDWLAGERRGLRGDVMGKPPALALGPGYSAGGGFSEGASEPSGASPVPLLPPPTGLPKRRPEGS